MRARVILYAALLAAVYVVVARLGLALDAVSGFAALVWPPTGLAIACLLLGRTALWPGVIVGAVTANLMAGAPLLAAVAIGVGNTLEALVAAIALRRLGFRFALERVRDVGLLTGAALLCPLMSAGMGVLSLSLSGIVAAGQAGAVFRAWWIGDALGALVVAPLVLVWWAQRQPPLGRDRVPEVLALGGLTAVVTLGVFAGSLEDFAPFRQAFLVFPVLVWAAIRFGQRTSVTMTFLISAAAIAATALRLGPFARPQLHEGLLALQVFLGVVAVGVMLLGAVVAERGRVQEALREAVAVRDEFLSIAGHELRTPLSALGLELGSLHRRLQENGGAPSSTRAAPDADADTTAPTALAHRAQRAIRQVERLSQLINRLLEVSQLQLGQLPLERTEMDLRAPVEDVLERFNELAEQAGCHLDLRAEGPVTGYWDPIRLEQVTTNLIANAIKYGPGKPIEVSVESQGQNAVLTVRDHGIGVPEGQLERIFDRFARAAPTRHFGGLGLGLYIARQIVQAHGGTIQVSSQLGAGSSFVVQLPLGRG